MTRPGVLPHCQVLDQAEKLVQCCCDNSSHLYTCAHCTIIQLSLRDLCFELAKINVHHMTKALCFYFGYRHTEFSAAEQPALFAFKFIHCYVMSRKLAIFW